MTWDETIVVVAMVVSSLLLFLSLALGLSSYHRSVYRYRLWRIRDRLWDAMFDNEIVTTPQVVGFKTTLERSIIVAHTLRPRDLLAIDLASNRESPHYDSEGVRTLARRLGREPILIQDLHLQYAKASTRYALSSPFGVLLLGRLGLRDAFRFLHRDRQRSLHKVNEPLDDPIYMAERERHRREDSLEKGAALDSRFQHIVCSDDVTRIGKVKVKDSKALSHCVG